MSLNATLGDGGGVTIKEAASQYHDWKAHNDSEALAG